MNRPSGMNEADTFWFGSIGFGQGFNTQNRAAGGPGVDAPAARCRRRRADELVPMSDGGWSDGRSPARRARRRRPPTPTIYFVDDHGIDAFGTHLVAGRNFKPEEITVRDRGAVDWPPGVIVTRALAEKLFPGQDAVGKQFYLDYEKPPTDDPGRHRSTDRAVAGKFQFQWRPQRRRTCGAGSADDCLRQPHHVSDRRPNPGRRDELMKTVETETDREQSRAASCVAEERWSRSAPTAMRTIAR